MLSSFHRMNRQFLVFTLPFFFMLLLFSSCNKWDDFWHHHPGKDNRPTGYSADVIEKWMALQLRLMRNATGVPNHGFSRHYVYAGIAAWESVAPGMPGNSWKRSWNGLTGLPQATDPKKYYWPANVNATLASINRSLFPNANVTDKAAIDSLENALNETFLTRINQSQFQVSVQFGKDVASAVYAWAETDGYKNANAPYTPPVGGGVWKPTPPAFAPPATPHWGKNRPVVKGSLVNTHPGPPPAYSTDIHSPFYKMVKKVYDASQNITTDQTNMAIYWRDVPGVSSPGHWLSILLQTVQQTDASLAKAALAYALTGAGVNDGLIGCFQVKYTYNLVRPITYIRETMEYPNWSSSLGTPAHPEYPSAHSALSAGAAYIFDELFSDVHSFTDHTYDYMGFASRSYTSFTAIAQEAGQSRLYAGIHYEPSIEAGLHLGQKTAANIFGQCLSSNFSLK